MSCIHATPYQPGVIRCARDQYGGLPAASLCRRCPLYDGPVRGLGDAVVSVIRTVRPNHVPCGECQKRRERLNAN